MTNLPLLNQISDYVDLHAQARPDSLALSFEETSFTYKQLDQAVTNCAKALLKLGVNQGDRVAYFGNPTPYFWIHFLATGRVGAIWTGLNPKYTSGELSYVMGDAQPRFIFAQAVVAGKNKSAELEALAKEADASLHLFGQEQTIGADFEAFCLQGGEVSDDALRHRQNKVDTHDPAFIVYTSGTTGRPKGALLSHYGANFCSIIAVERKGLTGRSIICNLPINHVGAIGDICTRTLIGGGTIHFQEKFDAIAMMKLIAEKRISVWGAVPAVFQISVNDPFFKTADLSSVDLIAWGGARMPVDLLKTLQKKTGATQFTSGYGMTETVGGVTYSRLEDDLEILANTIGTPDPRQPLRIWHAENRPICPGEEGEIQVLGNFIMKGYWERPEETADAFTEDGWFRTGDVAIIRPDGNLELVGRLSEMYKSGGYNVYPREVELAIEELEQIALAAVVSAPDPVFQEVGHAYIVLKPGQGIVPDDITKALRTVLANYKIPKQIFILDELPMLPIGKVDKKALKSRSADQPR